MRFFNLASECPFFAFTCKIFNFVSENENFNLASECPFFAFTSENAIFNLASENEILQLSE